MSYKLLAAQVVLGREPEITVKMPIIAASIWWNTITKRYGGTTHPSMLRYLMGLMKTINIHHSYDENHLYSCIYIYH